MNMLLGNFYKQLVGNMISNTNHQLNSMAMQLRQTHFKPPLCREIKEDKKHTRYKRFNVIRLQCVTYRRTMQSLFFTFDGDYKPTTKWISNNSLTSYKLPKLSFLPFLLVFLDRLFSCLFSQSIHAFYKEYKGMQWNVILFCLLVLSKEKEAL